jgi:hypothetical protein
MAQQTIDHGFEKRLRTRIEKHGPNSKVSGMINTSPVYPLRSFILFAPGVTVSPHDLDFLANNRGASSAYPFGLDPVIWT